MFVEGKVSIQEVSENPMGNAAHAVLAAVLALVAGDDGVEAFLTGGRRHRDASGDAAWLLIGTAFCKSQSQGGLRLCNSFHSSG